MEHLIHDLRYALRQLRKAPGFACAAIVILALGIGGTSAIFSTLNPILFEPLPYPHASRIMMIWYADEDGVRSPQAFHTYRELAERNTILRSSRGDEDVAAHAGRRRSTGKTRWPASERRIFSCAGGDSGVGTGLPAFR